MSVYNQDKQTIRGDGNVINGDKCTVYGNSCVINGDRCTVHGNNHVINGDRCTVYGENHVVNGDDTVLYANNCVINGDDTSDHGTENDKGGFVQSSSTVFSGQSSQTKTFGGHISQSNTFGGQTFRGGFVGAMSGGDVHFSGGSISCDGYPMNRNIRDYKTMVCKKGQVIVDGVTLVLRDGEWNRPV